MYLHIFVVLALQEPVDFGSETWFASPARHWWEDLIWELEFCQIVWKYWDVPYVESAVFLLFHLGLVRLWFLWVVLFLFWTIVNTAFDFIGQCTGFYWFLSLTFFWNVTHSRTRFLAWNSLLWSLCCFTFLSFFRNLSGRWY